MKTILKPALLGAVLVLTLGGDFAREAPLTFRFIPEAGAIIGRPFTPLSFAGVARRTAYRSVMARESVAVAATATAAASAAAARPAPPPPAASPAPTGAVAVGTIVTQLPAGCVQTPVNNVEYQKCGQTYYRAGFQGPNLIYVAQQP